MTVPHGRLRVLGLAPRPRGEQPLSCAMNRPRPQTGELLRGPLLAAGNFPLSNSPTRPLSSGIRSCRQAWPSVGSWFLFGPRVRRHQNWSQAGRRRMWKSGDKITVQPGPYHLHAAWNCDVSLRFSKSSHERKTWMCSHKYLPRAKTTRNLILKPSQRDDGSSCGLSSQRPEAECRLCFSLSEFVWIHRYFKSVYCPSSASLHGTPIMPSILDCPICGSSLLISRALNTLAAAPLEHAALLFLTPSQIPNLYLELFLFIGVS